MKTILIFVGLLFSITLFGDANSKIIKNNASGYEFTLNNNSSRAITINGDDGVSLFYLDSKSATEFTNNVNMMKEHISANEGINLNSIYPVAMRTGYDDFTYIQFFYICNEDNEKSIVRVRVDRDKDFSYKPALNMDFSVAEADLLLTSINEMLVFINDVNTKIKKIKNP